MTDHDAVLFDLDGVLVDSRVPFARSVNSALTSHGLTPRPARLTLSGAARVLGRAGPLYAHGVNGVCEQK